MAGTVVALGSIRLEDELRDLARVFGWFARSIPDVEELAGFVRHREVVAVLFSPHEVDDQWEYALRSVQKAAPQARLIVCPRFSNPVPFEDLARHGAFYQLHIPLARHEIRQCLGFLNSCIGAEEEAPSKSVAKVDARAKTSAA